jgi:hypothetical protein
LRDPRIGEKAAIQLAVSLHADLLLMDDRKGVNADERKGLTVTGTLEILDLAAHRGLINFDHAVNHLRQTTFRIPEALLDTLLRRHAQESGKSDPALAHSVAQPASRLPRSHQGINLISASIATQVQMSPAMRL